jgi:hypothetical protein
MAKSADPFRYFDSSPEVIRLMVMMYVRYPLSLRNVEDLLFERGVDICHETVRLHWTGFLQFRLKQRRPRSFENFWTNFSKARRRARLPIAIALASNGSFRSANRAIFRRRSLMFSSPSCSGTKW